MSNKVGAPTSIFKQQTETPWLSAQEQETWQAYLRASTALMSALEQRTQEAAGIPHTWYGLLARLSEAPGRRARQGDIVGFAEFSLSRLSYAIGKLEAHGWVTRDVDPADGRAWIVSLTEDGQDVLDTMAPDHVATVRRLFFTGLTSAETRTLARVFRKIEVSVAADKQVPRTEAAPGEE